MIVNELKPLLGEGWKEKFVHRDLWDPDGYGVASFDLGGEREKVLAINFATEDIMEHFYDDLPDDEWIELNKRIKAIGDPKKDGYTCYINKSYEIKGFRNKVWKIRETPHLLLEYPRLKLFGRNWPTHRIISLVFVPNPNPEKFTIVNHIDCNPQNYSKENLEWCDIMWNAKKENQKKADNAVVYERLNDNRRFNRESLAIEYPKCSAPIGYIQSAISAGRKWKDSYWKAINLTEEDYLSRHPLQDDWYQHPTMSNVRANGCGILEIDGKLRIGCKAGRYYFVMIDRKSYRSHRVLLECYLGRELKDEEIVDHIIPVTEEDTDNSIRNLRKSSVQENRRNPITAKKFLKEIKVFDLFGNLLDTFLGKKGFEEKYKINGSTAQASATFTMCNGKYVTGLNRLDYIYYRWEIKDGVQICTTANTSFSILYKETHAGPGRMSFQWVKKHYLNTGRPGPDGCYYQQGDPQHMIYDPDNKDLIKKRPEIFWKDRNKNNNEEGN